MAYSVLGTFPVTTVRFPLEAAPAPVPPHRPLLRRRPLAVSLSGGVCVCSGVGTCICACKPGRALQTESCAELGFWDSRAAVKGDGGFSRDPDAHLSLDSPRSAPCPVSLGPQRQFRVLRSGSSPAPLRGPAPWAKAAGVRTVRSTLSRRKGRPTHRGRVGQGDGGWATVPREGGSVILTQHRRLRAREVLTTSGRPLGNHICFPLVSSVQSAMRRSTANPRFVMLGLILCPSWVWAGTE